MAAAYMLAGELSTTPEGALQRYEQRLHAVMLGKQEAAKKFAGSFTPKTEWGFSCAIRSRRPSGFPLSPNKS
jgi:hypothetical protein